MKLKYSLTFADLYTSDGLDRLDMAFLDWLQGTESALTGALLQARQSPKDLDSKDESQLLIDLAPYIEDFIGEFFGLNVEINTLSEKSNTLAPLATCKRQFVQRQAARKYSPEDVQSFDSAQLLHQLEGYLGHPYSDLIFAKTVIDWMQAPEKHSNALDTALKYAALQIQNPKSSPLFQLPQKTNPQNLIPCNRYQSTLSLPEDQLMERDGFDLTDPGVSLEKAYLESHYCIWCHNQEKDSCRKGLKSPQSQDFKVDELGVTQTACPLDEKVSEMNFLRSEGHVLGALAVAMVDNPLIAGTGHRICNDCMKACIFQKQDPVNIPAIESQTLDEVLALPYGFEVYSLLSRWNPLNIKRPLSRQDSGYKALVAGMGPAGYTLAHYLLNEGHQVTGIDGLKIEPLDPELLDPTKPIKDISTLMQPLSERVMGGFGGVAEYGITVRWNKNYLTIIRLLLERRANFGLHGGVRLGGTLTIDQCKQQYDHIALCMGAGRPNLVPMKNALARGVRMASDFLMSLQLTGAAKADSIANLQVRLPIVVIGGGLTAIDTATEALAYYPVQVEKFATRYEALVNKLGELVVREHWSDEDHAIADEFLTHAKLLQQEREKAAQEGREPRIRELLQAWGGSTVVYRRKLQDSPSYRLNHEEVALAMEQGIRFMENHTPLEVELDPWGHAKALRCETTVPAKTILVAAGTHPNTVLAKEESGISLAGEYFQAVNKEGDPVTPERLSKPQYPYVLLQHKGATKLSFFGDLHPSYAGNVVKAMASAKQGYPVVDELIRSQRPLPPKDSPQLAATVHSVQRLAPNIIEVVVHAPQAAQNFKPGQFFRLQNYETFAPKINDTTLAMEGLAMTGAWVDTKKGLVSTIILEMGGSSDICQLMKSGEPCVLMGPSGSPTEIPENETVLLIGGGLGNAVLFSIGKAMRERGCKVIYFAGYRTQASRFKVEEIEVAADQVIWCCDETSVFEPSRSQDSAFVGTIIEALESYAVNPKGIPLQEVDRILTIGSDGMMAAVAQARHASLKNYLKPDHKAIGSINSPMQCMMKEICAQCLQPHQDPVTGEVSVVFSCTNQDQPLDWVDFKSLHERLGQNSLQEKLTSLWVSHCLSHLPA